MKRISQRDIAKKLGVNVSPSLAHSEDLRVWERIFGRK